MEAARWQRLKPWLDRLLDLEGQARAQLLAALPKDDADLHADLVDLLAQQDVAATLDQGAAALAAPVLAASEMSSMELEGERVGQQIGPYRIKRLLGSGGMGAVYLAERDEAGFVQRVALKVVRITLKRGAARERFDRERRILAELKHPNIAQLFDGGSTDDGAPYYTMEYVDGAAISDFCREHPGDVALTVRLMLKVASALAHAHQRLIIHRDIKPSNIMVTREQHVKLLDFGIAKPVYAPIGGSLTRGAVGPMTPEYAAPEQFRGGTVTVATDIYQFGMLLYRLLTGRFPYDADPADTIGWARAVTEQEPIGLVRALSLTRRRSRDALSDANSRPEPDVKHLRRWLGGDLDAIVRMCLAKRPDDRYRSMDALIGDLEAFLRGDPVSARKAGTAQRLRRFLVRHRIAAAIAAILGLGLVGITAYALGEAQRARAEAARAHDAMNFVGDLFLRLDPGQGGTRELKAEAMLAYAAERLDRDEIRDPNLRARLELMIGKGYIALGDFAHARQRLEPVITQLRNHDRADPLLLADLLVRAALSVHRNGRTGDAEQMLDEAARLLGTASAQNVDVLVHVYWNRSTIEVERAHYTQALPLAQQALEWSLAFDTVGGSDRTATAQTRLARVLKNLGRHDEAIEFAQRARAWYLRRYGEADPRTVSTDEMIGWILTATDRLAEAEPLLEGAAKRILERAGRISSAYANNAHDRGLLYEKLGRLAQARDAFAESAEVFASIGGSNSVERGWALWNLGNTARQIGDPVQAINAFEEADAIFAHNTPRVTPIRLRGWVQLVEVWFLAGQVQRAFDDAAAFRQRAQADGHGDSDAQVLLLALRAAAAAALGNTVAATQARAQALQEADRVADDVRDRSRLQSEIERMLALRPRVGSTPAR